MEVFSQIFVGGEYRCLKPKSDPTMILDCGANVGYTAAYFLTRFPRASLIAVEPDPENAELLERNLRPYGRRAKVLRTAVWSHRTGMVLSTEPFGDGREWARHVREVKNGETPLLQATDIGSIIDDAGHQRVGILKIDIEGAEEVIFGSDCSRWIDRVDNIAVEVHSPAAKEAFIRATGSRFDLSQHGDITLATRVAE